MVLSLFVNMWNPRVFGDEQERVQKKTFTNWINTFLKQKDMKVENWFEDIKDGVYLLSLLEALSGETLQMERGKLKRVHHVSNISTALKFLEIKKIKLVNINVSDIADGKPSIVLGLIWTLILYFQIEDTFAQQEHDPVKPLSALEKFRMNAKKALLAWTGNSITKKYGIKISDFGKSWRDGLAFNAIVHTIRPDLIDFENVRNQSARANLEQAFSTAEGHLGIARPLDPEDVDVEKPDEKSIMTYVAQFLKAYPEAGEDPALGRRSKDPATQEMNDNTDLMTWRSAEAEEVLQIVDQPVTDRQQEYMVILNADTREEKMTVEKQEVYLNNRRFCHGTKLLKSSLSLAPFFVSCAGGTGHGSSQPEHQGHSEIYPSTLNVVSNCPSLGEYMQRSFTKCADVCGSYMQDGNCAYHCMRDSSKTKLVEFCAKPKPLFDFCPEYDPVDQTIQKDLSTLCNSTFSRNYYNSSDIYFCDPNNCLQLRESSVRSGATTLTTLMNETTEINDGDSQELFVWLFVGLAALTSAIIIGYILHCVFVRRGIFSEQSRKMTEKGNQNGQQHVYTEEMITLM